MTKDEFNAWLELMGFSGLEAARQLGLAKNSVVKYRSEGAPEYIRLACQALAAQHGRDGDLSEGEGPRTFGKTFPGYQHEAGDRVFVAAQSFNDFIQEHPFITERPELAAMADQIGDALGELYQAVWRVEAEPFKEENASRGITAAASDKPFKVAEHKRERRAVKAEIASGQEPEHPKVFGNSWKSEEDGKAYLAQPRPEDM